jgi:hypothetical protein
MLAPYIQQGFDIQGQTGKIFLFFFYGCEARGISEYSGAVAGWIEL